MKGFESDPNKPNKHLEIIMTSMSRVDASGLEVIDGKFPQSYKNFVIIH